MKGDILNFPITLKGVDGLGYKRVTYNTVYDLVYSIHEYSVLDFNEKKPLHEIIEDMGLSDTMTLADDRVTKLIELYRYYNSSATPPAPFDSKIWYDTVIIMETFTPKMRF